MPGGRKPRGSRAKPSAPPVVPEPTIDDLKADGTTRLVYRVRCIAMLMARGQWEDDTSEQLQELWGVSHKTMEKDIAEAARYVRRDIPDDHFLAVALDDLDRIVQAGMAVPDGKGLGAAVKAIELRLKARGLLVKKVEHQAPEPMTPHELASAVVEDPELRPILEAKLLGDGSK